MNIFDRFFVRHSKHLAYILLLMLASSCCLLLWTGSVFMEKVVATIAIILISLLGGMFLYFIGE